MNVFESALTKSGLKMLIPVVDRTFAKFRMIYGRISCALNGMLCVRVSKTASSGVKGAVEEPQITHFVYSFSPRVRPRLPSDTSSGAEIETGIRCI